MLYEICRKNSILHRNIPKIIVTTEEAGLERLREMRKRGGWNGVSGLQLLLRAELRKMEPRVNGLVALFVPSTGIFDVHGLMKYFYTEQG